MFYLLVWGTNGDNAKCKNTVGCNMRIIELSAENLEEAKDQALEIYAPENPSELTREDLKRSDSPERMVIAEFSEDINIRGYLHSIVRENEMTLEQIERAEYERLKKKFG